MSRWGAGCGNFGATLACSVALALLAGCATREFRLAEQARLPAVSSAQEKISSDLLFELGRLRDYVESEEFRPESVVGFVAEWHQYLYELPPGYFLPERLDEVLDTLWRSRLLLRERLQEFSRDGRLRPEMADAFRTAFRTARFMEDYAGELLLAQQGSATPAKGNLAGGWPWTLRNPRFQFSGPRDLRSGDLLLARGTKPASAAIARLGAIDSQFSHVALVYVEPETGEAFTVEAHIEVGVVVEPLSEYLSGPSKRSVVLRYRHPDGPERAADIAHRAARTMVDMARAASAAGANIPYDFRFGTDRTELYCSEVAAYGYELAGGPALPTFPSSFAHMRNRTFLESLGIDVVTGFQPADLEVEPHFDVVAEWRDFEEMPASRAHDATWTKMYEWMDRYGYELHNSTYETILANLAFYLRRALGTRRLLEETFPTNMSKDTLKVVLALTSVGDAISDELLAITHGRPITAREAYEHLEDLRLLDGHRYQGFAAYDRSGQPYPRVVFHGQFRPTDPGGLLEAQRHDLD